MTWINNSKQYDPKTDKWFCSLCGHRTKIEVNRQWDDDGRPHRWEGRIYEWFTRCSVCHFEYFNCQYDCPHCGRPIDEEQRPIKVTDFKTDERASYEYGIVGHSWTEKHRCKTCGRRFWIGNGDW